MARKNDDVDIFELISFITIMFSICFFIVKFFIGVILFVLALFYGLITYIAQKLANEKTKEVKVEENVQKSQNIKKHKKKVNTSTLVLGAALASSKELEEINKNKSSKSKSRYTEEKLNDYCLTEYQKELVRKGDYEPGQFGKEDLEEGDFYYESENL